MKSTLKKIGALIFVFAMCMSIGANAAAVDTRASKYLSSYSASVTASSNGGIIIKFSAIAPSTIKQIGASYIDVMESTDGGKTWSTVKTVSGTIANGLLFSDTTVGKGSYSYAGTIGYIYKADVTCYASDASGSGSGDCSTGTVTAKR